MPLPPWALISRTLALSGPVFVASILTGMHLRFLLASEDACVGKSDDGTMRHVNSCSCSVWPLPQGPHPATSRSPSGEYL